jgi:hypothetical protein
LKVKIPPYPNFVIKEETLTKENIPTIKKNDSSGLSQQLIMMIPFKEGERRVIRVRPIKHNNKVYISALPNPVHLFLSISLEHFYLTEKIKKENFLKCGKAMGKDIFLLEIEENGTHQCYNDYIKYRSTSIIMLVSALEAFINHIIPNDFEYITIVKSKEKRYSKIDIESPKVFFKDKIEKVIPQYLKEPDFWNKKQEIKTNIFDLYQNRKNLIHLKTNAEDDFKAYFDEIDKMLELDIYECVKSIVSFMNYVKSDFIELEE